MGKLNQKGVIHVVVLLILLAGVAGGVYLVNRGEALNWVPKAFTGRLTRPPSVSGPISLVRVISPNGGETWKVGETRRVSWTAKGLIIKYVRIYIEDPTVPGSGSTNFVYDGFLPATQGYYDWKIDQRKLPGGRTLPRKYRIRIDGVSAATSSAKVIARDSSDKTFTIISSAFRKAL